MKQIVFDEGIREYGINGDDSRVIRVCITDMNIYKRMQDMESAVTAIADRCRSLGEPTPDELYQLDCEVRGVINSVFGSDVCTAAFGSVNCLSPVGSGRLMVEGFVRALSQQIRADIEEMKQNAPKPRAQVQAYLDDVPAVPEKPLPDIGSLTDEQRRALIRELTGQ